MLDDIGDPKNKPGIQSQVYLACTAEDLIKVEMDAWALGCDRATAAVEPALDNMTEIVQASERACDEALAMIYVPLDVQRFRDVFTRAWCAGYCTEVGRRGGEPAAGCGTALEVHGWGPEQSS
jgi:hypothetical protein